jgi:pentose-5-phosphate-3-epimerase
MEPNAEVGGLLPWLGRLDFLTLPGTAIGMKSQGLDPFATARLIEAAGLIDASGRRIVLAADGGIRDPTVPLLHAAGAETVVPGRSASVRRTRANGCAGCTGCRGQRRRGVRDAGWIFVRMRRGRQPGNRARAPETGRF